MNIVFASDVFTGVTRRGFLLRGILVVLLGILIALKPLLNLGIITMIAGWFFTLAGVWVLFGAALKRERRFFWLLYGVVMCLWGVFMIWHPFCSDLLLAWFLALWFVTEGVVTIWDTAQSPVSAGGKVLPVLSGLAAMFVGYAFFVWPLTSLAGMIWIAGLLLILEGLMLIVFSRLISGTGEQVLPPKG